MADSRLKKMFGDIAVEGSRSFLVVLAMSVGIFALGSVLDARAILVREMDENYERTKPAAVVLELGTAVGEFAAKDALARLKGVPGVGVADASGEFPARARVAGGEWRAMRLFVLPDFARQEADLVASDGGNWPPRAGEILIERAALPMLGGPGVGELGIILADGIERSARNGGTVHAPGLAPAWMERACYGWVTPETARSWGVEGSVNRFRLRVSGDAFDAAYVTDVAARARRSIEESGIPVTHVSLPKPGKHPHATQMMTLLFLLETFGLLAMALAAILTASMIGSLMSRQTRQIGIMKAIGGTARQVRILFYGKIGVFALVSCLVGMPLAYRAAFAYSGLTARLLNFTIFDASVPLGCYLAEIAISFAVPFLVSLVAIVRGCGISVRDALDDRIRGIGRFAGAWEPKAGGRLARPVLLSLRGAARKPARLFLSVLTLAVAGAIFISSMNVASSMDATVDSKFRSSRYDARMMFSRPVDDGTLARIAALVPGIETFEAWGYDPSYGLDREGKESEKIDFVSIPERTVLQDPPSLVEGRWLNAGDGDAVVVNQRVVPLLGNPGVGDRVTMIVGGRRLSLVMVGVAREMMANPTCYAGKAFVDGTLGRSGTSRSVAFRGASRDPESIGALALAVEAAFAETGVPVVSATLLSEIEIAVKEHFFVIAAMLVLMAALVVVVGALGLSSAMGITVLERTREIGILRAIGAGSGAVSLIVVLEGSLVAFASWILAAVAAWPVSAEISKRFGLIFFEAPLQFDVSVWGIGIWLAIALAISAVASYIPAARASSSPIREALAWE